MADITHVLAAIEAGEPHAAADLLPLVYDELRKLAAARLSHEKAGHTLPPTALVHEAYVRLAAVNPRAAELVKLRYVAGLTGREAAEVLTISPRKADQVWAYARAGLLDRLTDATG